MKTKSNNIRSYYIAYLALCGVFLLISSFWDLQINQLVNSADSYFGTFLARIGELPVYLVIPFTSMVFFVCSKGKAFKTILSFIYGIGGWLYLFIWLGDNWLKDDQFRLPFSVFFGLVFAALSFYIAKKLPRDVMLKLKPFAIFLLIAALGTALTVEGIKNIWGRVRFRHLLEDDNFNRFSHWFISQGVNGNKSFPSGHTSASSSSLLISALPLICAQLKKYEVRMFVLAAIYTFAVGFSRIIVGAHYLSDITVGALVGLAWFLAVKKFYLEKRANVIGE